MKAYLVYMSCLSEPRHDDEDYGTYTIFDKCYLSKDKAMQQVVKLNRVQHGFWELKEIEII